MGSWDIQRHAGLYRSKRNLAALGTAKRATVATFVGPSEIQRNAPPCAANWGTRATFVTYPSCRRKDVPTLPNIFGWVGKLCLSHVAAPYGCDPRPLCIGYLAVVLLRACVGEVAAEGGEGRMRVERGGVRMRKEEGKSRRRCLGVGPLVGVMSLFGGWVSFCWLFGVASLAGDRLLCIAALGAGESGRF